MFFTYWTHDPQLGDQDSVDDLPMLAEWQAQFSDFKIYDDRVVLPLLKQWGDDVPSIFEGIRIPSCKSDIARLVLLSEFGGFYIDAHTGIGKKGAFSGLIKSLAGWEVLLFDMIYKHKGEGDVEVPNGAIYSTRGSQIIRMLTDIALGNVRAHRGQELSEGHYIPYNIAALTGSWIIKSRLFDIRHKPFLLKEEFSSRVKLVTLRDNAEDPIKFYRYYSYRSPAMHWSERQQREPLFQQAAANYGLRPPGSFVSIDDKTGEKCANLPEYNRRVNAMPSSVTFGKPFIHFFVKEMSRLMSPPPLRFLDVGAGLATYPKMFKKALHSCTFTGVEVWSPYIEEFDLNYWYDDLIISDVRYLDWKKVPHFDVAFFGDVLEHMSRADAAAAVANAANVGGCVVTSIPLGHHPQSAELGNPWERHISENWNLDEISNFFGDVIGTHVHSFIGVSIICSNLALRRSVMAAYLSASDRIKTSIGHISNLDQFDYSSLDTVIDKIEQESFSC